MGITPVGECVRICAETAIRRPRLLKKRRKVNVSN